MGPVGWLVVGPFMLVGFMFVITLQGMALMLKLSYMLFKAIRKEVRRRRQLKALDEALAATERIEEAIAEEVKS